jgi:regulator of replication initiation timing
LLDQAAVFDETSRMIPALDSLERKLEQLLAVMQDLRDDNARLRLQAASLDAEKVFLKNKIEVVCERLAVLRDQIPEGRPDMSEHE